MTPRFSYNGLILFCSLIKFSKKFPVKNALNTAFKTCLETLHNTMSQSVANTQEQVCTLESSTMPSPAFVSLIKCCFLLQMRKSFIYGKKNALITRFLSLKIEIMAESLVENKHDTVIRNHI